MQVAVWSIPLSTEENSSRTESTDICPRCNEPFGSRKLVYAEGVVVHKTCPALMRREVGRQMPIRIHPRLNSPVLDTGEFGVVYTLCGQPLNRPAEADEWEIVPDLFFESLPDWLKSDGEYWQQYWSQRGN
jgi:hypothetical protein